MTLPDDYLRYPHRSHGMDQDLYDWRPVEARRPVAWPGGAAVAAMVVVPVEWHRLDPKGEPFRHPGAMVTPWPDLRHYTTRDYGARVGVFRLLDALAHAGIKATVPVNAVLLERARPMIEAIVDGGHEIAAYGLEADRIHWSGLEPGLEADWIAAVRAAFEQSGLTPRTWMSPARQQSFETLSLVARHGFDICLDWEQDSTPVAMRTTDGPVTSAPLSNELDDRTLLIDRRQGEDEWADQILEAARYMKAEAPRRGGQVLSFTLTPYVSGQPFRIHAVRRVLKGLAEDPGVWSATASEIVAAAR